MRKIARATLYGYCLLVAFIAPGTVSAQVFEGLEITAGQAGYEDAETDISVIVGNVIQSILGLLGIAFMLMLVYAGFLYLTARGERDNVERAKRLIRQAVIGIIIVSASFVIANFVLTELIGAVGATQS